MMSDHYSNYKIWQPLLLGLACCIGFWAGLKVQLPKVKSDPDKRMVNTDYSQAQKFNDVLSYIHSRYVDSLNLVNLSDAGIANLIAALDPYSEYIPAEHIEMHMDELHSISNDFGFDCALISDQWVVRKVEPQSSAQLSGIKPGAILCELNGAKLERFHGDWQAILAEHSPKLEPIDLRAKNAGHSNCDSFELFPIRKLTSAVSFDQQLSDGMAYLKIDKFSKGSYRDFMTVIEEYVVQKNCTNLIIDLRGNHGGFLNEAAYMLNQLIADKEVLLFKTSGFNVREKEFKTTGKPFFKINKIAVLIDGQTASAAELFAATLQDMDRAAIIGSPSFGKAMVLEQFNLADGSALLMSVSRFTSHSGRSIQKPLDPVYTYGSSDTLGNKKYLSSVFKRELVSNNGVWPDVPVQEDSIPEAVQLQLEQHIDSLIFFQLDNFNSLIKNEKMSIESNHQLKEYASQLSEKIGTGNNEQMLAWVHRELIFKIYAWFYGSEQEQNARLKEDPCLVKAMELINKSSVNSKGKAFKK